MIVFMLTYLKSVDVASDFDNYEVLEYYAGAARLAKLSTGCGGKAAAMDILYDDGDNKSKNNAMDINTSAGFLYLISIQKETIFSL